MRSAAQALSSEAEIQFLEGLRARYEAEGYTFTIAPSRTDLPPFFGTYVPDALARRPGHNIAIEVKHRQSVATQRALQEIRRLFEGEAEWQLNVVFIGADPLQSLTIPPAPTADIEGRIDVVAALDAQGHHHAAFVMAWSLLEAAFHSRKGAEASTPHAPGTVVQALAMDGYIEPETERRMRALISLRNRVVHGDLSAEPDSEDVALILSAIRQILAADAA